jgi:hypothetical protein
LTVLPKLAAVGSAVLLLISVYPSVLVDLFFIVMPFFPF